MGTDPKTSEPILFELKHRLDPREQLSPFSGSGRLDWRTSFGIARRTNWVWDSMPMSVAGLFLLLLVLFPTVMARELDNPARAVVGLVTFLAVVFALVEVSDRHRREYLTPTRLVRRYGLLGWGRTEIPLTTIERVEIESARYRPFADQWGDLHVFTRGYSTWIDHVFEPETAAQAILDVKHGRSQVARRRGRSDEREA